MATQVTNYQCPACTAPLCYGSTSGKLECEHCGSTFEVAEIEQLYAQKDAQAAEAFAEPQQQEAEWDTSSLSDDWGEDAENMRSYNCPSCGAELICDHTTAATSCPYCGNATIIPGQFKGTLRPDYVIPFKLDKQSAIAALKNHYQKKFLLPKAFKDENHIAQIQGVYVPFWLFDGKVDGDMTFAATRVHVRRTSKEVITTTSHYSVRRAGSMAFQKVPVDGSSKMPDGHMDSIEPFDYSELQPFSTAYLPGFLANKYDVDADASIGRADARCQDSMESALRNTVIGYNTCVSSGQKFQLHRGQVKYALLPVWMLYTRWKEQDYLFAMNGQTGKLVGDLPIDWRKFWGLFTAIALPLMALFALFSL